MTRITLTTVLACGLLAFAPTTAPANDHLQIALFKVDATPPLGSPLCNGGVKPASQIVTPLTARGLVMLGAGKPIVLCAVDWVGIGNGSHDLFRQTLAAAVDTNVERVTVHTLHQHDTPGSDLATEELLAQHALGGKFSNAEFDLRVIQRIGAAAKKSLSDVQTVTHVGVGSGIVEKVASNRRILGSDGRVAIVRLSSSRNAKAQAAPEGTIDPKVSLLSFWDGEKPITALTYYATHPQSYYGKGSVNWDFVGMARKQREESLGGVPHIHFDGAGGNVAAGKYNDGSKPVRPLLAKRLAAGMKLAWDSQQKTAVSRDDVIWSIEQVALPLRETLKENELLAKLTDKGATDRVRVRAARDLVFLRRTKAGRRITISCLQIGAARVLHMPGELFVEYQIAAQEMRPDDFVAMAAYGDYGPGYIGTKIAYSQGGYETGIVSRVAPEVEAVLMTAMRKLLREH